MGDWIEKGGRGASLRDPVVLAHTPPFRLGLLMIEPELRRVSTDAGGEEFLQARMMQVLVALARAAGEVVTRDDLGAACWGDRIVSDDSLNRVISRLRQLGAGLGQGSFVVETITKVGYRLLVVALPEEPKPEVSPAPAPSETVPEAPAPKRGPRLPSLRVLAPLLIALLVLVGAAAWLSRPSAPDRLAVGLQPVEAIGEGLPAGLAQGVDAELRAAFSEAMVPLTAGEGDLRLTVSVRRVASKQLRFSARIEEAASGALLWAGGGDRPLVGGQAEAQFAVHTVAIIKCAVDALARHPARVAAPGLTLTFQACSEMVGHDAGRQLLAARRLVRDLPDFWFGWHLLSYAIGSGEIVSGGARDPALFAEAEQAARRVIALQPDQAEGHAQLALAISPLQPRAREESLRRAMAGRPEECACSIQLLGDLMLQSGRIEEATALYQRAVDQNRTMPLALWRLAMGQYLSGRDAAGEAALRRLEGIAPLSRSLQTHIALLRGQWDAAAHAYRVAQPDEEAAIRGAMQALGTRDPAAVAQARAALEALPARPTRDPVVIPLLVQLGAVDGALERIEASRARGGHFAAPGRMPGMPHPLLFDPMMRPLWSDPRFAAYLERAGFIAYWRESGSRPDLCRAQDRPDFCNQLTSGG